MYAHPNWSPRVNPRVLTQVLKQAILNSKNKYVADMGPLLGSRCVNAGRFLEVGCKGNHWLTLTIFEYVNQKRANQRPLPGKQLSTYVSFVGTKSCLISSKCVLQSACLCATPFLQFGGHRENSRRKQASHCKPAIHLPCLLTVHMPCITKGRQRLALALPLWQYILPRDFVTQTLSLNS